MEEIRLQKYLADKGVASRRKCEELILNGDIKVNGEVVKVLGTKINPDKDAVHYKENEIKNEDEEYVYILLNKPTGCVTTVEDQFNRPTVLDLIKTNKKVKPVGRLDMYTSGALILTNDGDFIYKVTHPKHEIKKKYSVTLSGIITESDIKKLKEGVLIDEEYITKSAEAGIRKIDKKKNISKIEITIHEGKNRQVRKMCEAIGRKVVALHRCEIGNITIKNLKVGTWRYLSKAEVAKILE